LADFFRDRDLAALKGPDVVAFHLVTMGSQVAKVTASLFEHNAYRDYLELHGLSVQLTEALAELWHARIRADLGFARDDGRDGGDDPRPGLPRLRYSFGYPACPSWMIGASWWHCSVPSGIGVELSEELQLHPEQSTDAMIVHHPEAKYFNARVDRPSRQFARLAWLEEWPRHERHHNLQLAAALWDFDGTLADTEPLWIAAEYDLIGKLGGSWSEEDASSWSATRCWTRVLHPQCHRPS
jgi:hypothetical protein